MIKHIFTKKLGLAKPKISPNLSATMNLIRNDRLITIAHIGFSQKGRGPRSFANGVKRSHMSKINHLMGFAAFLRDPEAHTLLTVRYGFSLCSKL